MSGAVTVTGNSKRSKLSLWQKIRTGLKKLWSKFLRRKIQAKQLQNDTEKLVSTPPSSSPHQRLLATPAMDTPSKKIVRPTPSFVDKLENGSVLTLTETLTETPHLDGSYLERLQSPPRKVTVAPSSSWVQDVLGSSATSSSSVLMTSSLEIPHLASDDLETTLTLADKWDSSEDLYLYCYRS